MRACVRACVRVCVCVCFLKVSVLAHLSQKPICELIVFPNSGVRRSSSSIISNFSSKTACPIKAKFYMESPWVGIMKALSRHLGHVTKMAATPIYSKNPSKIYFSRTKETDYHETWCLASGTPAHYILFK